MHFDDELKSILSNTGDASITSEDLYQHYCAYCEGEAIALTKLEFSRLLKALVLAEKLPVQHAKHVASGSRGYQGLTVQDDMQPPSHVLLRL